MPIFYEGGKKSETEKLNCSPATLLVTGAAGFQPVVPFLGASFPASLLFNASRTWVDGVSPPAPPRQALPSALSYCQLLWNEAALFLQVVACKFSGRSLLNCVPIERNTITL